MAIRMVTFGGGTGHSLLLQGARLMPETVIQAVVPVTDSGGGTGQLRQSYGTSGSIGDLMRCVLALSPLRGFEKVFGRRYHGGYLHGQSVRNLVFAAAELELGLVGAAREMCEMLQTYPHQVIPVLTGTATLMAQVGSVEIEGEGEICRIPKDPFWDPVLHPVSRVWIKHPAPAVNPAVIEAIGSAEWLVVAPGDLMTSVLAVLCVPEIAQAVQRSAARMCVVMNIMTKNGETDGFFAEDFLRWIETAIGKPAEKVVCNDGSKIPEAVLVRYQNEHKSVLVAHNSCQDPRFTSAPLWMLDEHGVICHCPKKLFEVLRDTIRE